MSRFVNLELDSESEDSSSGEKVLLKDEAYYWREGNTAFEDGNFERGLRYYSKVLEFNPQNAGAWSAQVRMLIELAEFREAKIWADKALEKFPQDPELLAAKAVALGRNGELESALAFSDASIEERGDTAYVWLARGDVLLARREKRAEYCFQKAMQVAPQNWFVTWLAARIRIYYRQFSLALNLLEQALQWRQGSFLLWRELGISQENLTLFAAAEASFTQALQLNPDCREADEALTRIGQRGLWSRFIGWATRLTPS